MRNQPLGLCTVVLFACALAAAGPGFCAAQGREEIDTAAGDVVFQDGVLIEAHNRLTGETYTLGRTSDARTGLLWSPDRAQWVAGAASRSSSASGAASGRSAKFEAHWSDGSALATTVAAAAPQKATGAANTGAPAYPGFTVRQFARAKTGGLWGCQWAIAGLSDREVSLIVPAWSGVRLGRNAPLQESVLDWPTTWEAQLVIVQGRKGGLWVRADDTADRFKGLWIRHHDGVFDLGFRTYNEGPLADHATAQSVTWRVGFYRGDWRVPARQYRDWMVRTAGLKPDARRRPAWARDIRTVVILNTGPTPANHIETRAVLRKLETWVTPAKTLLYTPSWRRDPYDMNYPDYTAQAGYKDFVAFAHGLGYRVMPHTCYYGVSLENPAYQQLKRYQLRDLFTGQLITYLWPPAHPVSRIAMLHPGARAWRELYVRKCREIVARYGVDALHLDVSLSMPNVMERVDGLNTIEGNIAFQHALRTALPGVALGGEGLNEISMRYEAFAQTHGLFGINPIEHTADEARVDCSWPVSAFLFSPFTRWYGYLGYPAPSSSEFYRSWTRAYQYWGVAPTLSRPTLAALNHPSPDVAVRLEEMHLVDHYDLAPDFGADLLPRTICAWRGRGGAKLVYDHDGQGGVHVWFADPAGKTRTLYRYLRGRTVYRGAGTIGAWPAFDAAGLYGLDPDRTYLLLPGARDAAMPHLTRLPEGIRLGALRSTREAMVFGLGIPPQGIDLRQRFADADIGIVVGGVQQPLGRRAIFLKTRASCGGEAKDGFFAHPPWDDEHGVIGTVFAEWRLRVPKGGHPALTFSFGLRDGAEKTDGVTFSVAVDGKVLLRKNWRRCAWLPCRVDLSPYAGREIRLRLSVTKGPQGRGAYAWSVWGEPKIVVEPTPRPLAVDVLAPHPVVAATGPAGLASAELLRREGGLYRYRVTTAAPGVTCLFFRRPAPARLPVDLLAAPFAWTPTVGGLPLPATNRPPYITATVGEGHSGGATERALIAHPPIDGVTVVDYLLSLPTGQPAELRVSPAIEDGAKGTNGVDFIVSVDGREISRQTVAGPDGWHPERVDLGAYAGRTILLSLLVDARGDATCDWARWGKPMIVARGGG